MLDITQVVTAKLPSCMTMKNTRDQVMRRWPRGRVVHIRNRTRKFDMAIEIQPAYVCDRRLD